jgi:hypothetical protein
MSPVFTINPSGKTLVSGLNWERLGLTQNPFPESGVLGAAIYTQHMPDVFGKVTRWLTEVTDAQVGDPRGPFALEGTIGAGKTHLLAQIERDVNEANRPGIVVIRENLVNAGGGRLLLSTLFGANLRLGEIATAVVEDAGLPGALLELPSASPIRFPLESQPSAETLALWLRGAPLTRKQLQAVGGRTLDGEGERLRAVIHLLRVSALLGHTQLVLFLLDQLEDLERKEEVTALRRARFLTDLRIFIDEGLEGAPIALCTAWNTEGQAFMRTLEKQYPALASRLDNRATVPGLPQSHLLPFAQAYLDKAYDKKKVRPLQLDMKTASTLMASLKQLPGGDLAPREWLDQLRLWAEREARRVNTATPAK